MINAVNVPAQVVNVNNPILFSSTRIKTGCTVRHEPGSGRFILLKPGVYKVTFNGTISADAATTAILSITQDGEALAGAQIATAVDASPAVVSGAVTTLVRVYCCDSAVSVVNLGTTPLTITNANLIIDRLC